jgi:hypothetical protein
MRHVAPTAGDHRADAGCDYANVNKANSNASKELMDGLGFNQHERFTRRRLVRSFSPYWVQSRKTFCFLHSASELSGRDSVNGK